MSDSAAALWHLFTPFSSLLGFIYVPSHLKSLVLFY